MNPELRAEIAQARAARVEGERRERESMETMWHIRRENLRRKVKAGEISRQNLPLGCDCDECLAAILNCLDPEPARCLRRLRPESPAEGEGNEYPTQRSWYFAKEHTGPFTLNVTPDPMNVRRKRRR
jgi:hypothetical protein